MPTTDAQPAVPVERLSPADLRRELVERYLGLPILPWGPDLRDRAERAYAGQQAVAYGDPGGRLHVQIGDPAAGLNGEPFAPDTSDAQAFALVDLLPEEVAPAWARYSDVHTFSLRLGRLEVATAHAPSRPLAICRALVALSRQRPDLCPRIGARLPTGGPPEAS